jgi:hypothetical protein
MVNYRVGTSVQILRTNSLPTTTDQNAHLFPEDSTIADNPDSFLKFELTGKLGLFFFSSNSGSTGTPLGNSTAVLLLHEVLMNLADSNIVCCKPNNHHLKHDDQTIKEYETLSPTCDHMSEKPYMLNSHECTKCTPFPAVHASSPQTEEMPIIEKVQTGTQVEKSLVANNKLEE